MTDQTFAEIITLLETVHGRSFSDVQLRAWRLLIGHLPDREARDATVRLCRISSYPPRPADVVRLVEGDPRDTEQLLEEEAAAALVWFEEQFADFQIVDYGPVVNSVVRAIGGPDAIGALMVKDEWKFRRDEFRRLYKTYRRRGEGADPPVPANVAASGFALPAPRLALFAAPSIPGLPAAPQRPALPSGAAAPELSPELVPEPV